MWKESKHLPEQEILTLLTKAITDIEKKEKTSTGSYLLLFLKYLQRADESPISFSIRESLRKRYFFTIEVKPEFYYLEPKAIHIFFKIVHFFPYLRIAFMGPYKNRSQEQAGLSTISSTTFGLLEHLLERWYVFAQERELTFEMSCDSSHSVMLQRILYESLDALLKNNAHYGEHFSNLLEIACQWAFTPLKSVLLLYAIDQEGMENLIDILDPALVEEILPMVLSPKNVSKILKWIEEISSNPQFKSFIPVIKAAYVNYVVNNINELSKNSDIVALLEGNDIKCIEDQLKKKLIDTYYYEFHKKEMLKENGAITCCIEADLNLYDLANTKDDPHFFVGLSDGTVNLWGQSTKGTQLIKSIKAHPSQVHAIYPLRAGITGSYIVGFISGSSDKTIRLFKTKTVITENIPSHTFILYGLPTIQEEQILIGHEDVVKALLCIRGPRFEGILISGSRDRTIKIWDTKVFQCTQTLRGHEKAITCLEELGEDSEHIISASLDNTLRIWDVTTGECKKVVTITSLKEGKGLTSLAMLNQDKVVVGHADGTVSLVNLITSSTMHLGEHADCVTGLTLLDTTHFATCSLDKKVKIWDIETQKCIQTLEHTSPIQSLCALGTCNIVVTSQDGTIHIWERPLFSSLQDVIKDLREKRLGLYRKPYCSIQ